uniref:Uncharacterized protein n=1 Tax=Dipterosiphonia australica TaxID=2007208 RepID=A0A1Z1ML48_9FLOR|nr:hypothetical protein [Dipterosiphonia australica]ARW66817.1 hypothetical protein [Dipterosiphonia australica]
MYFLQDISSNNYIKMTTKVLRKQYSNITILFLTIFFVALPHISLKILVILLLTIELSYLLIFKSFYLKKTFKVIVKGLFFSIYTIILNHSIDEEYLHSNILLSNILCIYYLKLVIFFYQQKCICNLYFYCALYKIPQYLKKIAILHTINTLCLFKVSNFLRSHMIIKSLLRFYSLFNIISTNKYNRNLTNIFFSGQILEKIIDSIQNLYLGIKIKNFNSQKNLLAYSFWYSKTLLVNLLEYQSNFNTILWIKQINNKLNKKVYLE